MRKHFPSAHLILYVHNKLLGGLPAVSMQRALRYFDEVICVSDFVRKELEGRCRFPKGSSPTFRTVHHAVRTNLSFDDDTSEYDVVYVGRLVPEKGVHILTEAAALPGQRWRIAVVGGKYFVPGADNDPYVQQLHQQAAVNNLDIEFTGPVSPQTVADFLAKARVAVVTSIWDEPAGLTLLEAMASPAAVVASKVGGMPEMSRQGGVLFVPPSDARALRAAVDDLLANESKRKAIASQGRQEAATRSWRNVYDDLASA